MIGSAPKAALKAWHYDGSRWTDRRPTQFAYAGISAAALGGNGILYLAGANGHTRRGIVLSYGGSRWADVSPANPPSGYLALTVAPDETLIAAGGGKNDGTLQEWSGLRWMTVSLSSPVISITKVSVAPDGTVYAAGSVTGNLPVLIKQLPGSRSATVLDPSAADPGTTFTHEPGVLALGLDVWLLGEGEPHQGWHHPWFTYDDTEFGTLGRRFAQVAVGTSSGYHSDHCWRRTALERESIPGSSRCGWSHRHHHRDAHRTGPGLSLLDKDADDTWTIPGSQG